MLFKIKLYKFIGKYELYLKGVSFKLMQYDF